MRKLLALLIALLAASPAFATEVVPNFQFDTVTGNLAVQNLSGDQVTLFTISPTAPDGMSIPLLGATSGTTILQPSAVASGTLTFPAATDTLTGKATTDIFTNKTFDTAGAGNVFDINGNAISAVSGTGNTVALTAGPTFTAPILGIATATTINKVTLTAPAAGSTLTIADGKTLTVSNSLTFTGTDTNSFAFPSGSDTVVTLGATQTLTAKTLTTPLIASLSGGSGAASTLTLQSTTGAGTTDAIIFNTGSQTEAFRILTSRVLKLGAASFTANGAVATALSSVGPTGSHTTVQEWFTVQDSAGTVRWIPAF